MDDSGAGDDQRFFTAVTGRTEAICDLANCHALRLLRGNSTVHELEGLVPCHALLWKYPHPDMSDDKLLTGDRFAHRDATSGIGGDVDGDSTVHLLIVDAHPVAI